MHDNLSPFDADHYEAMMQKTVPFYEEIYAETISLVSHLKPDARIWLDTGCGTGSLIKRAYPSFPNTIFWLADPSPTMLEKAKSTLKNIPENNRIVIGTVGTEGLSSLIIKKPHIITAIMAHHYLSKDARRIATSTCYELLEAGGLYVTFENIAPLTEEGKEIALSRWKNFQISQGKTEKEADNHIGRYEKSYFPVSIKEHLSTLKNAGFRMAELFWFSNMQAGFYAIK